MIEINMLNKRYSPGSSKELQVIANTTLQLPSSGLISFLGKSGSGKTTLLNVIGGLDRFNSGSISYDGMEMKSYKMGEIDKYRQANVGYIFQNYLLLENRTVYDNLKIALEMIGVTDENEQHERIKYVLTSVGLYKYRKRPAGNLSGGQMQRVSIARALVKQCKVILADEPTGNLDSESTVEVMNILKNISRKTLVLLVTHNREIAEFYSDRVIEISDGKVTNDYEGASTSEQSALDIRHDKKIYLGDLDCERISSENMKINFYTAEGKSKKIGLNLVLKGDTVYVQSDEKIVVANDGNVELIEGKYSAMKAEDTEGDFDISWYDDTKKKPPLKGLWTSFKDVFLSFWLVPMRKRVFHFIFIFLGMIMGSCVISMSNYSYIDVSEFNNEPDVYRIVNIEEDVSVFASDIVYAPLLKSRVAAAVDLGYIEDAWLVECAQIQMTYRFNSVRLAETTVPYYNFPYSKIASEYPLLAGRAPSNEGDIVLGKQLADLISEELGLSDYSDLLNLDVGIYTLSEVSVCGVSSVNSNSCYTYGWLSAYGRIEEGDMSVNKVYEYAQSMYGEDCYKIKPGSEEGLKDLKLKIYKPSDYRYRAESKARTLYMSGFLVTALVLLAIVVIYVYFSMRSRLIMQIKSLGIYRCIGATRWQIIRKYIADILMETTFTSLLGYIIVTVGYSIIYGAILHLVMSVGLSLLYALIGALIVYAVNLIFGLLPVFMLLIKTPAEINSKYDI